MVAEGGLCSSSVQASGDVSWEAAGLTIRGLSNSVCRSFEANLKISSLLLILFPGPHENKEPGRTEAFLLRSWDILCLGFLVPSPVVRSIPKWLSSQAHGMQALGNKRMCKLLYWIILGM